MIEQTTVDHDFAKLGTRALIVLTLINMFNYIDRYVVPPLFESLRKEPAMGNPSDAQLGWLMTAFLIVYMMSSPLFGTLGDRMSRLRLIAFGVALWSCATTMGGFVGSFACSLWRAQRSASARLPTVRFPRRSWPTTMRR